MAMSKSGAGPEEDWTRFARLCLVIVDELTQILRDLLHHEIDPNDIFNKVTQRSVKALTSKGNITTTKGAKEKKFQETLIHINIAVLQAMICKINSSTSESEINQIYESIEDLIKTNKEDRDNLDVENLFQKLHEKITTSANTDFQPKSRLRILATFLKFVLKLNREYSACVKSVELPVEQHRKTIDSTFPYKDGDTIYAGKLSSCIGCICSGKDEGTGFRVGSKYVMTAFHVVEENLKNFWEEVYTRLREEEKCLVRWTENNIPKDGRWSISELIQTLKDPEKQVTLEEIGIRSITSNLKIQFGFVDNNSEIYHGMFSYDVPFVSPSCDVVILELLGEKNKLPKPISLNRINLTRIQDSLHVIGHPNGMKLQHDPACKVIKKSEELYELVNEGINFFSSQGFTRTDVEEDYEACVISPDHILFHCSQSTAHGSSGSPLIVISDDKPLVTGMLLRGHPKLCYNDKSGKVTKRPDVLVESGISMEKVYSLLKEHKLNDLADDLFSQ